MAQDLVVYANIEYVNQRKGNRPPSIKAGGNYYTISDAGLPLAQSYHSRDVNIGYYVNNSGFNVCTSIDGNQLPQDQRGQQARAQGNGQAAPSRSAPASAPAPAQVRAQQPMKVERLRAYTAVAVACIESGKTTDTFDTWVEHIGRRLGGGAPRNDAAEREAREAMELERRRREEEEQRRQQEPPSQGPDPDFDDDIPF